CRSARARHAPSAGPRYRNDRSEITATRRLKRIANEKGDRRVAFFLAVRTDASPGCRRFLSPQEGVTHPTQPTPQNWRARQDSNL
ncbi:MAG TPA: hypothetical protein VMB76_18965, partial [Casimicrobiaceae bacterium]|nr:hypothetical protein [Casimicrobiaceae bacterium]